MVINSVSLLCFGSENNVIRSYVGKNRLGEHIFLITLFQLYYPTHVESKQVHNQEVTSVHLAYIFSCRNYF